MSTVPTLDQHSRLELHALAIRREDNQVIVGRVETGEFVSLPEVGGQAIELLGGGRSVGEAESALSAQCGAPVDLVEFAGNLVELGFARTVDRHLVDSGEVLRPSLPWLRAEHCRWLFTRLALTVLALVVSAALVTVLLQPHLVPAYDDFFWTSSTSVVIAVNTLMVLGVVAIHELAHLAAARSLGVPGRVSLGTRLHMLVAQTEVTALWAVPRRRRYRAYLAGMAWDLLLLSCVLMMLAYVPLGGSQPLLSALALLLLFGLLGQLQLYMRTDLYFVLADLLRAKNLTEDAAAYVVSLLRRGIMWTRRRTQDRPRNVLAALGPRERRAVRVYAPIMVVGSAVALAFYARYGMPILVDLFTTAVNSVWTGATHREPAKLVDGLLTLAVEGGLQLLFVWVLLRNRGARLKAVWRRV